MELGKQIRNCRTQKGLSQDDLASQIYVSRQTISNWENDKNYPDVKSLLLLSSLFDVSLDQLVKGDLIKMREQIKEDDIQKFHSNGKIYFVLLLLMMVTPVPLMVFGGIYGIAVYVVLAGVGFWFANRIEKQKKDFNIKTYKEIIAFTEGKELSEQEKYQEIGKRPYQTALLAIGAGAITLVISLLMGWFLL